MGFGFRQLTPSMFKNAQNRRYYDQYIVKAVFVMTKSRMRIWEMSLLLALCFSLCIGTWAQAKQAALSSELVRLHVIAVSDDEYEQALKLRVRDEVLAYISPKLDGVKSAQDAQKIISAELDGIKQAAETAAEGRPVKVTLTQEYYPTRDYGSFSLPAGRYESLRVILGEGEGHNWWCVVFPPLCLTAAESDSAVESLDGETRGIVTEGDGYRCKFRIVELWGEVCDFFDSVF